ncbi:lipid asymmetry maintenance protein MlaB [Aurantimonas sp. VKM B-3413]|uniref:STAS domain-containing protein n=1 Tax=Aurantimonas sp. VKM B-3413 TaxID=2779401 RepID=UPI001E3BE133|nr:STAS domain-containing protein [Aurantimonas sp. VKM B-3413]MCB8836458.1 STAS domain-containing protein [Aurantimonas sp. VKM B-3413]
MNLPIDVDQDGTSIVNHNFDLVGECGIRNVGEMASALQTLADGDIRIDARGLTSADISVLQLLVSARKSAAAKGRTLSITVEEGDVLHRAIDRAGLGSALQDVLAPLHR